MHAEQFGEQTDQGQYHQQRSGDCDHVHGRAIEIRSEHCDRQTVSAEYVRPVSSSGKKRIPIDFKDDRKTVGRTSFCFLAKWSNYTGYAAGSSGPAAAMDRRLQQTEGERRRVVDLYQMQAIDLA